MVEHKLVVTTAYVQVDWLGRIVNQPTQTILHIFVLSNFISCYHLYIQVIIIDNSQFAH